MWSEFLQQPDWPVFIGAGSPFPCLVLIAGGPHHVLPAVRQADPGGADNEGRAVNLKTPTWPLQNIRLGGFWLRPFSILCRR